jgi:antibiotic biosynthesis monooxygenase (ABM) superfamily enzyme
VNSKEVEMQNWIRDGEHIVARYMGHTVSGVVESSRVKYGGLVQYTVNLDTPVKLRWRDDPTQRVLIDENELV